MQKTIGLTLIDRLSIPHSLKIDISLAFFGSLLIAMCAQIAIHLPFSPVPITGQTFAVLLVGFVLGRRRAFGSLIFYLLEGISGIPVFAGGGAGLPWLFGPTGGYLLGFVLAAALVGYLAELGFDKSISKTFLAFAAGQSIIYLIGSMWLSAYIGWAGVIQAGVIPFIPGDIVKAVIAALCLPITRKILK